MRLNTAAGFATHEGGRAAHLTPMQELRRSVMSCLLWEREFYEDGEEIAGRIARLAAAVPAADLAALAVEVRAQAKLRHAPLLLLSVLAETGHGRMVADAIAETIGRADEMGEFLTIHAARKGVSPGSLKAKGVLTKQVRLGLARALGKFDAYQLAKYDRDAAVKIRDVIRLARPIPADEAQSALWKVAIERSLPTPDTWEVALSGGADKRETFTRLVEERKLGYLALLRNLRNMAEAGVDPGLMREAIIARRGAQNVLPFRYVAAARACPQMEPALDEALSEAVLESPVLPGRTIVLVDVSGSMEVPLSLRSDLTRLDAAATLASVIHGERRVFSFASGNNRHWDDIWDGKPILVEVPPRLGMAGVDAIDRSQLHGGTMLGQAVLEANAIPHDRLIVITDEQSEEPVPDPVARHAYVINVASARHGVGYGRWTHIDGFSETVLRWIGAFERA